jgi:hypothetical protein
MDYDKMRRADNHKHPPISRFPIGVFSVRRLRETASGAHYVDSVQTSDIISTTLNACLNF